MIEGLLNGLDTALSWPGPLLILIGVVYGALTGVLPGLGGASSTALLLPATYAMDPSHAIFFIIAANVSSGLGGQLTAILVNVPGDPPNAAAMLDGYPMTKQGRAAEAIGAATLGSVVGALVSTGLLLAVIPVTRELLLAFSYPEFFLLSMTGLVMIAALTTGNMFKGLIAAGVGLMIAFIGLDPATGNPRFTFGQVYLWDGIDLVPALIGLFAGAEMLSLFRSRGAESIVDTEGEGQHSTLMDGFVATVREWKNVLISSVFGFLLGVVPGIGGTVASFMAYGRAARASKHPERFGHGEVGGLIAAETANDADKTGTLLPTIAFAIPGGASMAIILAALLLHGFPTGPAMLRGDSEILYVIVIAMILPRLVAAVGVLVFAKQAIAVTRVPGNILAPIVTVIALVGVFALRNQILDVWVALVFAYVGYAMERFGYSRVVLVIALVLSRLVEAAFHQTMGTFGIAGLYTRPISLVLLVVIALTLFGRPLATLLRRSNSRSKEDVSSG
jgi:putative tricarboxylic transport membrane protein